ncbi:hypothetical protein [Nitrosomonas sp.]|uniref:hypothetical protein n=1 Tax=Nitrosomonas sp. TaxID=42353 RepID=UPI0025F74673|nr:hypothetical protein [Nitrosomonas sp.]MBY0484046.1 hypothetical protein [Nitrosomonas sp.]
MVNIFSQHTPDAPGQSENTISAALRCMGYEKDEIAGHGFRSMASTLFHEHDWSRGSD